MPETVYSTTNRNSQNPTTLWMVQNRRLRSACRSIFRLCLCQFLQPGHQMTEPVKTIRVNRSAPTSLGGRSVRPSRAEPRLKATWSMAVESTICRLATQPSRYLHRRCWRSRRRLCWRDPSSRPRYPAADKSSPNGPPARSACRPGLPARSPSGIEFLHRLVEHMIQFLAANASEVLLDLVTHGFPVNRF